MKMKSETKHIPRSGELVDFVLQRQLPVACNLPCSVGVRESQHDAVGLQLLALSPAVRCSIVKDYMPKGYMVEGYTLKNEGYSSC